MRITERSRRLLSCLLIATIFGWLPMTVGNAQGTAGTQGQITAFAFDNVPSGTAISVEPLEDTDANLELLEVFKRSLAAGGYVVSDNAPYFMYFSTDSSVFKSSHLGPNLFEFNARTGTAGESDADFRVRLFSTRTGETEEDRLTALYSLEATVQNQGSGKRVWQGTASVGLLGQPDEYALAEAMVPILIERLGQQVSNEAFELP